MKRVIVMLGLLSSVAHANDHVDNRFTATANFGMTWMQVEGVANSGMSVQPTFNRAFDRFELQIDLLLADLKSDEMEHPGSVLHRFGFAARHQVGRIRVERSMTMDCVVEAGLSLQYLARDTGDALGRSDLSIGLGLRMLVNVTSRTDKRALMGMETMGRFIITPSGDKAFVVLFGVPFGR